MQKDEAEKILGKRIHFSRLQYLVRWKGEKKNSWEPLSNLKNALDLIEEYENKSQVSDDELVIEQKKPKKIKKEGSYDDNDSANEILNIRKDKNELEFFVDWKQRNDNIQPDPSWIKENDIRMHNPEILCDYLMKKIQWPSKKKT